MTSNYTVPFLRVLFPREFPAVNVSCRSFPHLRVSNRCPYPGLMVEIIGIIADHLNSTIIANTYSEESANAGFQVGTIENGKVTGLMGQVFDGEADTIAYPFQKTDARMEVFDFSRTLYNVECNIVHRKMGEKSNSLWTFFTVYDNYSWLVMFSILLLQGLFYIANQYCQSNEPKISIRRAIDSIWLAVQIQLGQAVSITMKTYAVKFNFLFVSMLQGVILMGVYSSWILSQKLAIDKTGDLNGNKELIAAVEDKSRYFVSTTASDWFFEKINRSDVYPFNSLRQALKNNPIRFHKTMDDSLEEANTKGGLIALVDDDRLMFLSKAYCNLVRMEEPISIVSAHLLFRKNSPLVKAFDEAINKNEMLIARAFKKYMDSSARLDHGRCRNQSTVSNAYFGLCFVWAGLMAFGTVIVVLECMISGGWFVKRQHSPGSRSKNQKKNDNRSLASSTGRAIKKSVKAVERVYLKKEAEKKAEAEAEAAAAKKEEKRIQRNREKKAKRRARDAEKKKEAEQVATPADSESN